MNDDLYLLPWRVCAPVTEVILPGDVYLIRISMSQFKNKTTLGSNAAGWPLRHGAIGLVHSRHYTIDEIPIDKFFARAVSPEGDFYQDLLDTKARAMAFVDWTLEQCGYKLLTESSMVML